VNILLGIIIVAFGFAIWGAGLVLIVNKINVLWCIPLCLFVWMPSLFAGIAFMYWRFPE
jgi:hypothetical protein